MCTNFYYQFRSFKQVERRNQTLKGSGTCFLPVKFDTLFLDVGKKDN